MPRPETSEVAGTAIPATSMNPNHYEGKFPMNMDHNQSKNNLSVAALASGAPITMSSREIAELVEARHDNVKVAIERLVKRGVIVQPAMQDEQDVDSMGRARTTSVYHLEKRDSFVVVAQLSPEFTARLVDRWQQLEEEKRSGGFAVLSGPQLMAAALIEADATMKAQAAQIEGMRQDVVALDRIAKADGSLCITDAAKALQMRPKDLFGWLRENGWIYRRTGAGHDLGYQAKTATGLLEHKVTTVLRADGSEKITEQVRVTSRGLEKLAKLIQPTARLIGGAA